MSYESTTHKLNLTGGQISTVLYCLEGYVQGNDDTELCKEVDNIFAELQSVTDNYYAQLEEINELKSLLKEGR
jgi:hypothetical protein